MGAPAFWTPMPPCPQLLLLGPEEKWPLSCPQSQAVQAPGPPLLLEAPFPPSHFLSPVTATPHHSPPPA